MGIIEEGKLLAALKKLGKRNGITIKPITLQARRGPVSKFEVAMPRAEWDYSLCDNIPQVKKAVVDMIVAHAVEGIE